MAIVFPYALVTLVSFLIFCFALRFRKTDRLGFFLFMFFSISVVCIFVGMRSFSLGLDSIYYAREFVEECGHPFYDLNQYSNAVDSDIGYLLWMKLVGIFTDDARVFFIVTAYAQMIPFVVAAVKKSERPALVYLISLLLIECGFNLFINLLRQGLACCFLLWAGFALIEKRSLKFSVLTIAATTFHVSCICFMLLGILLMIRNNQKNYILICVLIVSTIMVFPDLFHWIVNYALPRYAYYFDADFNSSQRIGLGTLLRISLCFFVVIGCYLILKREKVHELRSSDVANISFFYGVTALVGAMLIIGMTSLGILERLSLSFIYFLPFAIVYVVQELFQGEKKRKIVYSFVIFVCVILFVYRINAYIGILAPYVWG